MSILSDKQIRQLCVPPTFMVTEVREVTRCLNGAEFIERTQAEVPSWSDVVTLSERRANYAKGACSSLGEANVVSFRFLTTEEKAAFKPMIEPFSSVQVRADKAGNRQVSWGLTSFGYDVRCADEFKIFTNINSTRIDPKNFDPKNFVDFKGPVCIVPPNSFVLARTLERFDIPRDVVADCLGKSTFARCGLSVLVTPLEPEWSGYLTLEFANTTPLPALIYANEGCAQIRFFRGTEPCEVSYKDRNGKYQNQPPAPVTPRI